MKELYSYIKEGTEKDKIEYYKIKSDFDKEKLALGSNGQPYDVSPQTLLDHKFYIPKDNVSVEELAKYFSEVVWEKILPNKNVEKIIDALEKTPMHSFIDFNEYSCLMKDTWNPYFGEQNFVKSSALYDIDYNMPSTEIATYIDAWIQIIEQQYPARKRMNIKQIEKIVNKELMDVYKRIPNPASKEEREAIRGMLAGVHKQFRPQDYR